MKLLLTSAGLSNKSIKKAFLKLTGKPASKIKIAFVLTASNLASEDKKWLIKDLCDLQNMKIGAIDIVDFSAVPKKITEKRLKWADVIYFEGGNTFYLMHCIDKFKMKPLLSKLLKNKVYVGVSAGSIVACKKLISLRGRNFGYGLGLYKKNDGMKFTDFSIRPHMNNKHFKDVTNEKVEMLSKELNTTTYFLDDNSAILVDGKKVEVISEGSYKIYE